MIPGPRGFAFGACQSAKDTRMQIGETFLVDVHTQLRVLLR